MSQKDSKEEKTEAENSNQTPEPQKKESVVSIVGSVDKKYKVPEGEEDLVHVVLVDHASPRSKDLTKPHKPQTRILKTSPHNFVQMFANNFTENDMLRNVTTPGRVAAILINLDKDIVGDLYADEIHEATKGKPRLKGEWIDRKLEEKERLKVVGGNQMVSKDGILHIPTNDPNFPFNAKDLKAFPEDCLY